MNNGEHCVVTPFDEGEIERTCLSLKAICHPVRMNILALLGNQALSVQEISELVALPQSTTSQHLAVLRGRELLMTRKRANRVYYQVRDPRLLDFIQTMNEVFAEACPRRVSRVPVDLVSELDSEDGEYFEENSIPLVDRSS